jgi:hypothetical protein
MVSNDLAAGQSRNIVHSKPYIYMYMEIMGA